MEGERLGITRASMLQNHLLIQAPLGKARRRGLPLPEPGFIYGRNNYVQEGGVASAISHWDINEPVKHISQMDRDFVALNRAAVKAGLVTAPEHYYFRATHDIRCKDMKSESGRSHITRLPPDMTFGISTRPSTPISDLLANTYQDRWLQDQRSAEKVHQAKDQKKVQLGKVFETRASLLRKYQPPIDPAPLWQLPRFQKIGPHLETFRDPELRRRSYRAQNSEAATRSGHLGQGIYNTC
ncbi:cilia- and flagella-associated protein 77 [Protopterus annectens]|uniref:cilia- and flagella-associated protein 77 n=1 Tax=Protopterus annectens TaxID=7888 RepID=UPI001CFB2507|nr:cilia- and flagella-associated protein 77 [Protopterus annectens]